MDFNESQVKNDEYELQYYGIVSSELYECIRNKVMHSVEKICNEAIKSLQKCLTDEQKQEKLPLLERQMKQLYINKMTPYLLQIKEKITKYLRIPDNVLLPEDEMQAVQYSEPNIQFIKMKHKTLLRKLQKAHMFQSALKRELDSLTAVEENHDNDSTIEQLEEQLFSLKPEKKESLFNVNIAISLIENTVNLNKKIAQSTTITDREYYNQKIDQNDI